VLPHHPEAAHMNTQRSLPRARTRTLSGATILQIVPALDDSAIARTAIETAMTLMQAGARAAIAGEDGPLVGKLQTYGGEWLDLVSESANPLRLHRNAKKLERYVSSERVDIVHAHGAGGAWSALAAAANLPVWLVTSLPEQPSTISGWRGYYARALARGDRIIASSTYAASHVMEHFAIERERVAVIPRSVDTQAFNVNNVSGERIVAFKRACRLRADERIVLVPGRVCHGNGQHVLVEAARILADRGMRKIVYVIAGDDQSHASYAASLTSRIKRHALEPVFRMTSMFRDMPAAFAASTVVAFPAIEPPAFGRAIAEAQAMSRPVVATRSGVLPENLLAPPRMPDELRTGWLVRPDNPVDLAGALGTALQLDKTAYFALAARARQFAEFMFSPASVVAATRNVYTSLIARDR
jgi:glycosyltransferase involved in cell wall biosynthesis